MLIAAVWLDYWIMFQTTSPEVVRSTWIRNRKTQLIRWEQEEIHFSYEYRPRTYLLRRWSSRAWGNRHMAVVIPPYSVANCMQSATNARKLTYQAQVEIGSNNDWFHEAMNSRIHTWPGLFCRSNGPEDHPCCKERWWPAAGSMMNMENIGWWHKGVSRDLRNIQTVECPISLYSGEGIVITQWNYREGLIGGFCLPPGLWPEGV